MLAYQIKKWTAITFIAGVVGLVIYIGCSL
jgi:hypothetical protein